MPAIEARSYSLSLWLFARGHSPIDAVITPGGALAFTFDADAAPDVTAYHEAKGIFNGLEARARVLHLARQRRAGGAA